MHLKAWILSYLIIAGMAYLAAVMLRDQVVLPILDEAIRVVESAHRR